MSDDESITRMVLFTFINNPTRASDGEEGELSIFFFSSPLSSFLGSQENDL